MRDSKSINSIDSRTQDMNPKVSDIKTLVVSIVKQLVLSDSHTTSLLDQGKDIAGGINSIKTEMIKQQQIAKNISKDITPIADMQARIEAIYRENAQLQIDLKSEKESNRELSKNISKLVDQNRQLHTELNHFRIKRQGNVADREPED